MSDKPEILYNSIMFNSECLNKPNDFEHIEYLENPPEIIDVSVGRQLFVDDFLIENTDLTFEYHKAKKYENNPVFKAETPWEIADSNVACPKSGGVWYDEEEHIFKMWYEAGWLGQMCYAVSNDGIRWERPNLHLEENTNKILLYKFEKDKLCGDTEYLRPDSTTFFIDYNAPKNEKYKMFLRNPGDKHPGVVAVSEDGINFRDFTQTSMLFDRSTVFYNPFRKKWVYSIREVKKTELGWDRFRLYRECDNLLNGAKWQEDEAHLWMYTDERDKPLTGIEMQPQLYNVDVIAYESIMLGMFQILYGPENAICERTGTPKITELMPMFSRNGYNFSRPCRESIISVDKNNWDRGYIQSVGGVTIINGDELWIYYSAFSGDNSSVTNEWYKNGMYKNGAVGLAVLRRDGFVSVNGNGTLTTRKLTVSGKTELHINMDGKAKVCVCDENGKLIACSETFEGNSTNAKIEFKNFDITKLNNSVFRLQFVIEGKLYSFGFSDKNGDFRGAHAAGIVK